MKLQKGSIEMRLLFISIIFFIFLSKCDIINIIFYKSVMGFSDFLDLRSK
jgi:hypothetical protein